MGISRREILKFSLLAHACFPLAGAFAAGGKESIPGKDAIPLTVAVLKEAYEVETVATRNYVGFSRRALDEKFPNIAYLFLAFSESEKIHADNYRRILLPLGEAPGAPNVQAIVSDTRDNLQISARNEMKKINETYPLFLKRLQSEANESAVVSCMYSWKSHRQHEEEIRKLMKYTGWIFGQVMNKIEKMDLSYFICGICGSTISASPEMPCIICNYPMEHYRRIERPS